MPANVVVPEVGESIVDARVAKWLKREGDAVTVGEPLVELETDKIDLEVAAAQAGVLGKIAHGDGADVKVGEALGVIEDGGAAERAPAAAAPLAAAAPGGRPPRRSPKRLRRSPRPRRRTHRPQRRKERRPRRATPQNRTRSI